MSDRCKVCNAIEKYGLSGFDEKLINKRTVEEMSLRDLTDYTNKEILRVGLSDSTIQSTANIYGSLPGNNAVETIYQLLHDKDGTADQRARIRTQLQQEDIDIGSIESDWVTHPTIRKHLQECLDVDTSRTVEITISDGVDTIEWGRTRCRGVVDQTIQRLMSADKLDIDSPRVTVDIQITCEQCNRTYRPDELLESGTCDCQ
ncbi:hypothetical protein K0C01_10820 [Salinarchaeum sp. IM2453]|uniref:rod-determining factor RdfA n=1 Tax=Salinarchaeum sp. IM2453 TaxID=2862870 RepID=UPI001C83B7D5|nr:rod-determining factor RdfA [Salinarchaeum sp. IM2453]QZA88266.1 hypothetical protein K0C01_10820 [Salinarchaeum sp. IM2453]